MTKAPLQELQEVIYSRLVGVSGVTDLVGTRVYTNPPDDVTYPFVRFGTVQTITDDEECRNASDVFMNISAFSRKGGFTELYQIADAIKDALHDWSTTMTDNALRMIRVNGIEYLDTPDARTTHAVVKVHAIVEEL